MFNSKDLVKTSVRRFDFGINENVYFKEMVVGETDSKIKFIDLIFEQKDSLGTVVGLDYKRLWWPDEGKVLVNEGETTKEALTRDMNKKLGHIVYVLETAYAKPMNIEAKTWDEFIAKSLEFDKVNRGKSVKLNILMQYDKDGVYSEFPNSLNYVEAAVEGQPSTLKFTKWQLNNRCQKGNGASSISSSGGAAADDSLSDLF